MRYVCIPNQATNELSLKLDEEMQTHSGNPVKIKVIMMMGQGEEELLLEKSLGNLLRYAEEPDQELLTK